MPDLFTPPKSQKSQGIEKSTQMNHNDQVKIMEREICFLFQYRLNQIVWSLWNQVKPFI